MNKIQAGHISIILETLAFFFVTIDLYGKERLIILRNRIQLLKIDVINRKFDHPIKHSTGFNILIHTIGAIPVMFFAYFTFKYGSFLLLHCNKENVKILIVYISIICLFTFLIIWKFKDALDFFKYLSREIFLFYLVKSLIFITKLFPVEGVMITIGATLYIIAKIISYCVVGMDI